MAECVCRLEEVGIIIGYSAQIDSTKVGMPLLALIHVRYDQSSCLLRTSTIEEFPEVLELHKLSCHLFFSSNVLPRDWKKEYALSPDGQPQAKMNEELREEHPSTTLYVERRVLQCKR
jgi:DNA-binding Lrp family transcriptional regulator